MTEGRTRAAAPGRPAGVHPLLGLQQSAGNRAVAGLVSGEGARPVQRDQDDWLGGALGAVGDAAGSVRSAISAIPGVSDIIDAVAGPSQAVEQPKAPFQIQETSRNKSRTADRAFTQMDEYIRN